MSKGSISKKGIPTPEKGIRKKEKQEEALVENVAMRLAEISRLRCSLVYYSALSLICH
jgi:hypothetical protein